MSNVLRRIEIPLAITAICALIQVIPYYFNIPIIESTADTIRDWMLLVVNMAVFVGVISLGQVHGKKIQRKSEGWVYSAILIVFMVGMAILGFPLESIGLGFKNEQYLFLFNQMLTPLGSTMYGIIAFFITAAAYRAFRARNIEATIVLLSGTIVMMANAPLFTSTLTFLPSWKDWIFDVPNASTMRAVLIGAALGAVALAVRTMMGIERGYLRGGGGEE